MSFTIHGIQHLGVGVPDHELSWKWYRKFFGMDIPLFNDEDSTSLSESAPSASHIKQLARQIVAKERVKKLKKEQMEMIVAIDEVPFDVEDVLTPDSSDVPFDVIETVQDDWRLKYLL